LSGAPLQPLSLQCIRRLRFVLAGKLSDELTIIGGGGIYEPGDIDVYAAAGAGHFAVGTKLMHPRYLFGTGPLETLLHRARAHRGGSGDDSPSVSAEAR
jgi:dihydroorotate dehydrogenase